MSQPISTLYLTGANNHEWERTGPFLRDILSASGDFAVAYTEDASAALEGDLAAIENAGFQETLLRGARWAAGRD